MFFKTSLNNNKVIDYIPTIIKQTFPDHYPLLTTFNIKPMSRLNLTTETYLNKKILTNNCSETDWSPILTMHDPELAMNKLVNLINSCINNATKKKTMVTKEN